MRIMIDAGHGGTDSGAINNTIKEKDINLVVANELQRLLTQKGFQVAMTRNLDTSVTLNERCVIANTWKADLFISIHHNASGVGADGSEVIHSISYGKGKDLAELIRQEFEKLGQNSRGVYAKAQANGTDYYAVIRQTNMPAIITEFAFLDSIDFECIDTLKEQLNEAQAICNAVCRFAGISVGSRAERLADKLVAQGKTTQKEYWLRVFNGKEPLNLDYVMSLLEK